MRNDYPDPPAHAAPFVEVLGVDSALALFLEVGGTPVYLTKKPSRRSLILKCVSVSDAERLAKRLGYGYHKVPLVKKWIAAVLRAKGNSNSEIARILHSDVATVRRWLPPKDGGNQMDFFRKTGS